MTTAGFIKQQLDSGAWTPLEAAEGLIKACGDDYVDGVTPSAKDPDTWLLIAELVKHAALEIPKLVGIVKAFL